MFRISIKFRDEPTTWGLLFEDEIDAKTQWDKLLQPIAGVPVVLLTDGYGQTAFINLACIAGAMFEDMDKSMLAGIQQQLHNHRTTAKGNQMAASDPVLKTAMMAAQRGPAIFDPQGNGLGHR